MVVQYIGATTSAPAGAIGQRCDGLCKRKSESDYAADNDLPLSAAFEKDFAAYTRRYA